MTRRCSIRTRTTKSVRRSWEVAPRTFNSRSPTRTAAACSANSIILSDRSGGSGFPPRTSAGIHFIARLSQPSRRGQGPPARLGGDVWDGSWQTAMISQCSFLRWADGSSWPGCSLRSSIEGRTSRRGRGSHGRRCEQFQLERPSPRSQAFTGCRRARLSSIPKCVQSGGLIGQFHSLPPRKHGLPARKQHQVISR